MGQASRLMEKRLTHVIPNNPQCSAAEILAALDKWPLMIGDDEIPLKN